MKKIRITVLCMLLLASSRSFAATAGDYRSDLLTGDWGNTLTWLKFNGLFWLTDLSYPGQNSGTGNVEITANRTVMLDVTPAYPIASLTITSGTLKYNSTAGRTLNVSGNIIFSGSGNMSVVNAANTNIHTLKVAGNITMASGTGMDMVSNGDDVANVVFTGSGNQVLTINGAATTARFHDLTINKSSAAATVTSNVYPFSVKHDLIVSSGNMVLAATADVPYKVENNVAVASGNKLTHNVSYLDDNHMLQVGGDLVFNGDYIYTGYLPAINMYGSGTKYVNTGSTALCKLFLSNGDFKASGNVTVNLDFYAMWNNATGSFHTNGQTISAPWGIVNSGGTLYVDGGSLTIGNTVGGLLSGRTAAYNGNVIVSAGTLTTPGILIGSNNALATTNATCVQSGGTVNAAEMFIGVNSTYTYSGGNENISASLLLGFASSNYINNTGNAVVKKITGDFINNGTYNCTNTAVVDVYGNWINNGTFTAASTSKVVFRGTADQTIGGTGSTTFGQLLINPAPAKKVSLLNNISISSSLDILSGTFDQNTFTANRATVGGVFTMAANSRHRIGGTSGGASSMNNFPANFSVMNFDAGATTEYAASGDQQLYSTPVYGHLLLSNAGTKIAGNSTIEVRGNFINTAPSVFDADGGTIRLSGANQQFAGVTYSELQLANGGIKTAGGSSSIQKKLSIDANTTLALGSSDITLVSSSIATANIAELPASALITYGSGRFITERFMPAKKAWRFVATPVMPGVKIFDAWQEGGAASSGKGVQITGPGAAPATNGLDVATAGNSLKYYNPANGGYTMISNTRTTDLANEKGYMIFVRGDRTATTSSGVVNNTVLRTKGRLITGTKTYAVAAGKAASVGNPYASRIDLTKVFDNGGIGGASNVAAAVTVWDPQVGQGANGVGRYRTYTRNGAGNFELTPAGIVNNYIESGQAFFVQSQNGGTLTLQENVKTDGSAAVARGGNLLMRRLRSNIWGNDSDGVFGLLDGTLTDIDETYANTIDNMDVRKTMNQDENISILSGGKNLIVERRQSFAAGDTIFYNISGMKQQAYEFRFLPSGLPAGMTAFLEDNFLKTSTVISLTENTNIPFTITATAGSDAATRFRLVFKALAVLPVTITSISASRKADHSIAITWKVENEINIEKYIIERSADGINFIGLKTVLPGSTALYSGTDQAPLSPDNFYSIKAVNAGGRVQYSAIVKVATETGNGSVSVYPNPVTGKKLQLQFNGKEKGFYNLQLRNQLGQILWQGSAQVTNSHFIKSVQLGEQVPTGTYQLTITGQKEAMTTLQVVID